jgi:hypothetical protein
MNDTKIWYLKSKAHKCLISFFFFSINCEVFFLHRKILSCYWQEGQSSKWKLEFTGPNLVIIYEEPKWLNGLQLECLLLKNFLWPGYLILNEDRCLICIIHVSQWLTTCRRYSLSTPFFSTNKANSHDKTELFLKVALNKHHKPNLPKQGGVVKWPFHTLKRLERSWLWQERLQWIWLW